MSVIVCPCIESPTFTSIDSSRFLLSEVVVIFLTSAFLKSSPITVPVNINSSVEPLFSGKIGLSCGISISILVSGIGGKLSIVIGVTEGIGGI